MEPPANIPRVALIDAGGANLGSVRYALARLGVDAMVTSREDEIARADRIILPGVGAAGPGMRLLRERGLLDVLRDPPAPLLGICLGMQLLFDGSEESDVECLGLLPGLVSRLPESPGIRVPHMGWNALSALRATPLLDGIKAGEQAYFVHSYAAPVTSDCVAECEHGIRFAAVVQRGPIAGAQFHPERSAAPGSQLLRNFIGLGARDRSMQAAGEAACPA
ncbi:MAG: imidazole glycerol phosphate synthase subunit HisH [Lysobacteraceae bacterium]